MQVLLATRFNPHKSFTLCKSSIDCLYLLNFGKDKAPIKKSGVNKKHSHHSEVNVFLDYIIFDCRYDIKSKLLPSQSDLDLRNLAVRPGHLQLQKRLARTEYLDR